MSNDFNFCREQSLILQYANSLFIIVSKCGCQTNIRNMNINIMKRLTVHGTGFKLLLHVSIGHFRVPKTLTFKMRLGAQSFL